MSFEVLLRTGRRLEHERFVVDGEHDRARQLAALILGVPDRLVVLEAAA